MTARVGRPAAELHAITQRMGARGQLERDGVIWHVGVSENGVRPGWLRVSLSHGESMRLARVIPYGAADTVEQIAERCLVAACAAIAIEHELLLELSEIIASSRARSRNRCAHGA